MYDKNVILDITTKIADRVGKVRMGILDTSIYGSSNIDLQKQTLHRTASELVHSVRSDWGRQAIAEKARELEGQLQTSATMGLIGQKDLQEYLGMIDDVYATLDQEN